MERRGRDVKPGIEAAPIGEFGASVHLEEGLDGLEPRLARIASLRHDPIDAGFDPPVALLDGRFAGEFGGRGGAEIVLDLGFERGWLPLRASR
jgi:hypothetical protein